MGTPYGRRVRAFKFTYIIYLTLSKYTIKRQSLTITTTIIITIIIINSEQAQGVRNDVVFVLALGEDASSHWLDDDDDDDMPGRLCLLACTSLSLSGMSAARHWSVRRHHTMVPAAQRQPQQKSLLDQHNIEKNANAIRVGGYF